MNQQFSDEEDHLSDGNPICQLLVYTEEDGNIYFSCDWSEIDEASTSLGAMLYRLSDGELVNEILNNLKSQCVLEGAEEDFFRIVETIKILIANREDELERATMIKYLQFTQI
jgi:hypothetical protein